MKTFSHFQISFLAENYSKKQKLASEFLTHNLLYILRLVNSNISSRLSNLGVQHYSHCIDR